MFGWAGKGETFCRTAKADAPVVVRPSHLLSVTPEGKISVLSQSRSPSRWKNGQHGNRDCGLSPDCLRMDPGVVHPANRLLEGVLCGWDGHHHSYLLVQPVENMCDWFHWCLQLQGLPFNAGSGWWALKFVCHDCCYQGRHSNISILCYTFLGNCSFVNVHLTKALISKITCCFWMNDYHCKQMHLELDISFSESGSRPFTTTTFKAKGHQRHISAKELSWTDATS